MCLCGPDLECRCTIKSILSSVHSRSSSQISVQQYPEVSVHDQLQAGLGSRVDTGTGYYGDNDQIPTPTALHQPQTLGTAQGEEGGPGVLFDPYVLFVFVGIVSCWVLYPHCLSW